MFKLEIKKIALKSVVLSGYPFVIFLFSLLTIASTLASILLFEICALSNLVFEIFIIFSELLTNAVINLNVLSFVNVILFNSI